MTDAPLHLYYNPHSRAAIAHWMLEELGVPYKIHLLNLQSGEHKRPEYLAINPMGKVPAIKHGDVVVTENAAICCYLADIFLEAGLAPAITDPRRGPYLRWLFFSPSCIEPAIADRALKREAGKSGMLGYGTFDTVMDVTSQAVSQGDYLLGDMFSAADVVLGSTLAWGMLFGIVPQRPEFTAYVGRLQARPAAQRSEAKGKEHMAAMGMTQPGAA